MARTTVQKTLDAADTVLDWLHSQRRIPVDGSALPVEEVGRHERPGADDPTALETAARGGEGGAHVATTARRTAGRDTSSAAWCLPHTDWLHHRLVVTGAAEQVGPTPTSVPGGMVIHTDALQRLLSEKRSLVLDLTATGRSLPSAVVLGDTFAGGSLDDAKQERLRRKMRALTGGDTERPIVTLSWNAERWGSRNLALRLVALGYTHVHWYRGGKEVWEAGSLPETDADKAEW